MVGSIVGEGFVLDVDYGAYSDRLDNLAPYERAEAETIEVGGKRARLVRGTLTDVTGGERHFYGLHVAAIAPSAVGPLALTLTAKVRNRATLDLLTQMVRSIRFKPAP